MDKDEEDIDKEIKWVESKNLNDIFYMHSDDRDYAMLIYLRAIWRKLNGDKKV
jgi:hypothetical protein